MSINICTISGNLTSDPELRMTQSGMSVLTLCVAVNDRHKNVHGDWEDYANFIDCVVFGKRAESLSKILVKGQKVVISGRLRWSSWEAEDGRKRSKINVIANDLDFISKKNSADAKAEDGSAETEALDDSFPQIESGVSLYDEDIPF